MEITVEDFDPDHVTEDDLTRCHEIYGARWAEDRPTEPPITRDGARHIVQVRQPGADAPRWAAARTGGVLVGLAKALPMIEPNAGMALVDVTVDPALRRRGIGTALLRHVVADVDRPRVAMWNVAEGGPGERWAVNRGMRRALSAVCLRADLADVPGDEPPPPGYRLLSWRGAAPEDVVAAYAVARRTIADAPTGSGDFRTPEWTVESVRDHEARLRAGGLDTLVVVATRGAEVAALTEVFLTATVPHRADQGDTAVVPAHRGRGLGRCVKLRQLALLRRDNPAVTVVYTANAEENAHMRRVNEAIGFRRIQTLLAMEGRTADLR